MATLYDRSEIVWGSLRGRREVHPVPRALLLVVMVIFPDRNAATTIPALAPRCRWSAPHAVMYLLGYSLDNLR
jgi:hypothetical protein